MWMLLTLVVVAQTGPPPPPPPAPAAGAEAPLTPPPLPPLSPPPPPPDLVEPQQPVQPLRPPTIANPRYEAPVSTIVHFNPLSLFGLYLGVELEHLVSPGWSVFGGVGGGVFGQLGLDAGVRFWGNSEKAFDGVYGDARLSMFSVPATGFVLAGVGGGVGYGWRTRRTVAMSVGFGLTLWTEVPTGGFPSFAGSTPQRTTFLALPGLQTPDTSSSPVAVQPTLRFTLGPAF